MNGSNGPFEYDKHYGKSRTPILGLVPLKGVPHCSRRGPPRRGCGEGGNADEDRASRDSESRVGGRSRSRGWSALASRL